MHLSKALVPLRLTEGKKGDLVAVGGDGGLPRLQWPPGHREVVETAALSPAARAVCRLGPRVSRLGFPGDAGEVEAAALRWNKSSRTLPPLGGALLRHRRRVCGGESSRVGALFRSCPAASRRFSTGMRLPIFCFKVAEAAAGLLDVWRVDPARVSCGGGRRRRRGWIQDRGDSGRVPGRWATSDGFIFCGSLQSLRAMESSSVLGRAAASSGDFRWRVSSEAPASIGGRDLLVIFLFLKALCASWVGLWSSVSLFDILVFVRVCVRFP